MTQLDKECELAWLEHEHQLDLEHQQELAGREVDMFYARLSVDPYGPEDLSVIPVKQESLDVLLLWEGASTPMEEQDDEASLDCGGGGDLVWCFAASIDPRSHIRPHREYAPTCLRSCRCWGCTSSR